MKYRLASCLVAITALAGTGSLSAPAQAQLTAMPGANGRTFPVSALRGELTVGQPPEVVLDGTAERLPPGARIYGTNNLIVLSASITGQSFIVNYTRDHQGALNNIWILTPQEARQPRRSAHPSLWQRLFGASD